MEDELVMMLKGREWVYRFLSTAFFEKPEPEKLELYIRGNAFAAIREDNPEAARLSEALEEMGGWEQADWEQLGGEHIRLFSNSGPVTVPPWESVYRSEEHIIYDEHTLAVQDFYREWGIEAADRRQGPADHIGLECGFMAVLTGRSLRALEKGESAAPFLKAQSRFLDEHLLTYSEQFSELLVKNSQSGLYQGIGGFLQGFLKADSRLLGELAGE